MNVALKHQKKSVHPLVLLGERQVQRERGMELADDRLVQIAASREYGC